MKMLVSHWYIMNNVRSISLLKYYVKIIPIEYDNSYELTVYDREDNFCSFVFNDENDAIRFTEDVINDCENLDEIVLKYNSRNKQQTLEMTI